MDYNVSKVALHHINQEDHTFRITTTRDKSSLIESIKKIGLLVPPTLWSHPSGLKIVSGFRRIQACQRLGVYEVTVRIVPDDAQPLECIRMALNENISQRSLNLIETARAIRLLKKYLDHPRDLTDELTMLGLPTSRSIIDKLDRLSRLPFDLQAAVLDGTVCLNVALDTGKMSRQDQMAVLELFSVFPMSVSKQKEVVMLAKDIAGRDHKTICNVLQSEAMQAIIRNEHLDRNKKTDSIRRHLRMVRYPNLSQAETQYRQALKSLRLGPHMRIDPPPAFEGTIYTLTVRFKNRRDLEVAYRNLGAALENPAIEAILPK